MEMTTKIEQLLNELSRRKEDEIESYKGYLKKYYDMKISQIPNMSKYTEVAHNLIVVKQELEYIRKLKKKQEKSLVSFLERELKKYTSKVDEMPTSNRAAKVRDRFISMWTAKANVSSEILDNLRG